MSTPTSIDATGQSIAAGQLVIDGEQISMNSLPTVRQLVAERPGRARVFEKWKIPYCCCGGNKTLSEICVEKGLDENLVLADLRYADVQAQHSLRSGSDASWSQASLPNVTEHIIRVHHRYLREELIRLSWLMAKVVNQHSALYPELLEMQNLFEEFKDQIEKHMDLEEQTLFPQLLEPGAGPVSRSISALGYERIHHTFVRDTLTAIREITERTVPPERGCNTYRVLVCSLAEFETRLQRHIHVEEDILFPRALPETEAAADSVA
jgi:regulator of cell morphogenesis and NO signaling